MDGYSNPDNRKQIGVPGHLENSVAIDRQFAGSRTVGTLVTVVVVAVANLFPPTNLGTDGR